jgi:hypothetical protein
LRWPNQTVSPEILSLDSAASSANPKPSHSGRNRRQAQPELGVGPEHQRSFLPKEALDNRSPLEAVPCANWHLRALTGAADGFSRASLIKFFFGSRFDLDPVESELDLSRNNSILVSNYLDILAWTSMRNRLLGARSKPRMTHELAGLHTRRTE